MKTISTLYAQQNGLLRGRLESILDFFDDMDKDLIKDYLEETIRLDEEFDKIIKGMKK